MSLTIALKHVMTIRPVCGLLVSCLALVLAARAPHHCILCGLCESCPQNIEILSTRINQEIRLQSRWIKFIITIEAVHHGLSWDRISWERKEYIPLSLHII